MRGTFACFLLMMLTLLLWPVRVVGRQPGDTVAARPKLSSPATATK